MEVIINSQSIDTDKIQFKKGKNTTKILYDISSVYIIGLCFGLECPYSIDKYGKLEVQNKQQKELLQRIDQYLSINLSNYVSFLKNDKIQLKNYKPFVDIKYININNIKKIDGFHFVNIFSL